MSDKWAFGLVVAIVCSFVMHAATICELERVKERVERSPRLCPACNGSGRTVSKDRSIATDGAIVTTERSSMCWACVGAGIWEHAPR